MYVYVYVMYVMYVWYHKQNDDIQTASIHALGYHLSTSCMQDFTEIERAA